MLINKCQSENFVSKKTSGEPQSVNCKKWLLTLKNNQKILINIPKAVSTSQSTHFSSKENFYCVLIFKKSHERISLVIN